MPIGKSVPICSMKRRLGRVASHDVTKCLEKLDARLLEGHFAMRLPGRLARDIRSRWKTSHSKVIFYDFIATGGHLLSSCSKEKRYVCFSDLKRSLSGITLRGFMMLRYDYIIVPIKPPIN